ncbi:uncharacterized protein RAG0_00214 [Rhynchosporium agropyri]|uniref:LysM domain-containing protein n=1 Tax=Rhynchosporium agropyri TaxID=914238 RepID=A0A1E1JS35_9HELO|nr:uncharacterized protein RAG0_00214 [Rhynchosporium agropyri]
MHYTKILIALSAWFCCSIADFNLYPPVDSALLAKAYNLTQGCIQALNGTLNGCDPTLFQMSVSFDNYYWEDENITDVCDGNCTLQARDWDLSVSLACSDQWISAYGKLIPADSISGRFVDGLKTVCLGSTTDDRWCLGASQNWTGADIIQPDCNINPSDPSCSSNVTLPEYTRMANLYSNDVLCDNCFVQMLYARITSPFLADSDQSDFLVSQLQDIGDVCNITVPEIVVRALPGYVKAPPVTSTHFGGTTTTSTTSIPATSTTCAGQLIASGSGCAALSTKYGIATGDLQKISGSDTCVISSSTCFPAACTLQTLPTGATCDSFAAGLSGNITTVQLLLWNRNIQGLCDSLTAGQSVCVSAPGVTGSYTLAPPPLGTGADAGNQQRGGPGGRVTPCLKYTNVPSATSAPGPTQTGIVSNCNAYAMADLGIGCFDFATQNCINTIQLWGWNGVLGKNGENCQTLFWAKEYYCVNTYAVSTASPTTTSSTTKVTSSSTRVTAPGPTQTGIVSNCNKFATPLNGIGCFDFATQQGITQAQLYTWNPVLGTNGANCGTSFWAQEYYCVGVSS